MLFRAHRSRSLSAVTALALVCALLPGFLTAHRNPEDDAACATTVVAHDASAHRVGASTLPPGPDRQHCYTCHWLRALGSLGPSGRVVGGHEGITAGVIPTLVPVRDRLALSNGPSRAPPA